MHNSVLPPKQHEASQPQAGQQGGMRNPIEEEQIPFVDSDHEDDCGGDGRPTAAINSSSQASYDDDTMTESQEDLARAYIHRNTGSTLAERRMQEKLTVSIDTKTYESNLVEEAKDEPTELKSIDERSRGLRRNSISLPSLNVNELDALRLEQEEFTIPVILTEDASSTSSLSEGTTVTPVTPVTPGKVKPMLHFNDESSSDEEDRRQTKYLFRTKRRTSIAPLPALRLNDKEMMSNDFDTHSVMSNQASITSVNSLASLLKEKMQNLQLASVR